MNSELDVFLIPHAKMKQLVRETSSQVRVVEFDSECATLPRRQGLVLS